MEAVKLEHVTKEYRLYGSEHSRFKAMFSDKVKYKPKVAVSDISLTVNEGERVAILGPNGAGKTTLLKMILGVYYPTSGTITTNGSVSPMLETTAGFDAGFTGRENIRFRGKLIGLTGEELDDFERRVTEFAELDMYLDQPLRTYSSVMKAKLGYAININIEPKILLMDEALASGDGEFRKKCLERLGQLVEREDSTFIYATHVTRLVKRFCKRGIVMRKGVIEFDGPIEEAVQYFKDNISQKEQAETEEKLPVEEVVEEYFDDEV